MGNWSPFVAATPLDGEFTHLQLRSENMQGLAMARKVPIPAAPGVDLEEGGRRRTDKRNAYCGKCGKYVGEVPLDATDITCFGCDNPED